MKLIKYQLIRSINDNYQSLFKNMELQMKIQELNKSGMHPINMSSSEIVSIETMKMYSNKWKWLFE